MGSTKNYLNFILEQLNDLNITYKPMMGEYLLYFDDVLFGGIYDDNLLLKIVESNKKYHMEEVIPYDGAKPMFMVDEVGNKEVLKEIIKETYKGIINKKSWGNAPAFLLF